MNELQSSEHPNPKGVIRKLNAQAAKAHVNAWQASGLSAIAYCRQHNLAESTFYSWRQRYSGKSKSGFTAVKSKPASSQITVRAQPKTDIKMGSSIKLTLPNGIILDFERSLSAAAIVSLIKELM